MIQYKGRTGIISRQHKKGVDLFLLPCSQHPEPESVFCVDPEEVTLCDIPPRWLELNGGLRGRVVGNDDPNLGDKPKNPIKAARTHPEKSADDFTKKVESFYPEKSAGDFDAEDIKPASE